MNNSINSDGDNSDIRAGRAALLDLLADLLLHELEAPTAARLARDPALAAALAPPEIDADLRDLRAIYARLLLIDVPPYASVYLDVPPVIGGEASLAWERLLAASGQALTSLERAAAPDHAGLYLRALAAAERTSTPEQVGVVLREALRWLPQALTAITRNDAAGFYARVAEVAAHTLQACAVASPGKVAAVADEEPPKPEDDSLREITHHLSTPAWSGWFLSKSALRQLARPFGVSVGMVDRDRMLEQVFEASALDERTDELLDALLGEWRCWQASLAAWRSELGDWAAVLGHWDKRLQHTQALLNSMRLRS